MSSRQHSESLMFKRFLEANGDPRAEHQVKSHAVYIRYGVLYFHGSHFPLAMFTANANGDRAILVNTWRYSVSTTPRIDAATNYLSRKSDLPVYGLPNLRPIDAKGYPPNRLEAVVAKTPQLHIDDLAARLYTRLFKRLSYGEPLSSWDIRKTVSATSTPNLAEIAEFLNHKSTALDRFTRLADLHAAGFDNQDAQAALTSEEIKKLCTGLRARAKRATREAVYCLAGYEPIIFGHDDFCYEMRRTYHGSEATARKYIDAANAFRDRFRPKAAPLPGFDTIAKPIRAALALKKLTGQWSDAA
jgi:hypothetical protein